MTAEHVLAIAIITQAVDDYRAAIRSLSKKPKNKKALKTAMEVEEFFRSDWYKQLTEMDGEHLLERLRKEEANESGRIPKTDSQA